MKGAACGLPKPLRSPLPRRNFIWRQNQGAGGEGKQRGRPGTSGQLSFVNSEDCRESLSPPDKGNGPWSETDDLQTAHRQQGYCAGGPWGLGKIKSKSVNRVVTAVGRTRTPQHQPVETTRLKHLYGSGSQRPLYLFRSSIIQCQYFLVCVWGGGAGLFMWVCAWVYIHEHVHVFTCLQRSKVSVILLST